MRRLSLIIFSGFFSFGLPCRGQNPNPGQISAWSGDVRITIDRSGETGKHRKTVIIFYALPNGNSTEQTMGKLMSPGDDWHFDIQHVAAQTGYIRLLCPEINWVVVYLENRQKSWPAWKQAHPDFRERIPRLVDSLREQIPGKHKEIYLNGHSGGGSFIFGYLAGVGTIPSSVKRISFIDSNYGYDSTYLPMLNRWLGKVKKAALNVFAYNDSIALFNGKPVVSATGGTWYRSHLMLQHFAYRLFFERTATDSVEIFRSANRRVQFFFKPNLNRGIYHTQQVELNGFIHSVLCGTRYDSRGYSYYGKRAYEALIE